MLRRFRLNSSCGIRSWCTVSGHFLSVPTESNHERRSGTRIATRVPTRVRTAQGAEVPAHTRDVSANGIFLYSNSKMEQGSEVELVLILPPELTSGEKCWVCCQATVVRVEDEGTEFGVARSAAWTSFRKSVFSGSDRSLANAIRRQQLATCCAYSVLDPLAKRMPRVAHRKRGTEIEDINLDLVKIGDTILNSSFFLTTLPGGRSRQRGSWRDGYFGK